MSSFGRDDLSHLSMSLHMELNRTYTAEYNFVNNRQI